MYSVQIMLSIGVVKGISCDQVDIKGALLMTHCRNPTRGTSNYLTSRAAMMLIDVLYTFINRCTALTSTTFVVQLLQPCATSRRRAPLDGNQLSVHKWRPRYWFNVAYVDNLIVVGYQKALSKLKSSVKSIFFVAKVAPCTHFLSIKVAVVPLRILFCQLTYSEHIICLCGMKTPRPRKHSLPLWHCLYELAPHMRTDDICYRKALLVGQTLDCLST